MSPNEKASAANGGRSKSSTAVLYERRPREATHPGTWLNPRRRRKAEELLAYVIWHGRKVYLSTGVLSDLRQYEGMDVWAVQQASDDLYALGVVDLRLAGDVLVVEALTDDIDIFAHSPKRPQAVVMLAARMGGTK